MKLRRLKKYHAQYWPTVKWLLVLIVITFALFRGYKVSVDNQTYQASKESQAHIEDLRGERDYLKEEVNKLKNENQELKKQVSLPQEVKVASYIKHKFGKQADQAMAVAKCESGLRVNAHNNNTNRTTDSGIFQINSVHIKRFGDGFLKDWKTNVDVAYKLYSEQGWVPWRPSNRCHGLLG